MANDDKIRLPIKVVGHDERDFRKPTGAGGPRKVFGEVGASMRSHLIESLDAVEREFEKSFASEPDVPAVARVILRDDAIAKSHRPATLFSSKTCPIIGGERLGELLVSVGPSGLKMLRETIGKDDTKGVVAALSTVQAIQPYRAADRGPQMKQLRDALASGAVDRAKLRMFQHGDSKKDHAVINAFRRRVDGIEVDQLPYGRRSGVFRLHKVKPSALDALAAFVGTQGLERFPSYRALRLASTPLRAAQLADFPAPLPGVEYPVVGVIDTGVDPNNLLLRPWIAARESYVPAGLENFDHGTFVAGLVVHGRALNGDPSFPIAPCKIVDIAAIPNDGSLGEDELIVLLAEVVAKYASVVRVWNLSLGTSETCTDHGITDLGAVLDEMQDQHGVTFVVAAGNINEPPFRGWPAPAALGEHDRITSPADSTRAITVGAHAHIHRPSALVPVGAPSPFSRRGPGPAFIPKPELTHAGGNCGATGQFTQMGVCSLGAGGSLAENVGTSFAAPLVTSLLATIDGRLGEEPSPNLMKALLVQSAVLRAPRLDAANLRYTGFGTPGDVNDVLACTQDAATLIFEVPLRGGFEFEKVDFPIPACLRDGNLVRGEFIMTLVYDPPLQANQGAEYCRANVEASLGSYTPGDGARGQKKRVPEEPRNIGEMYEKHLVEHGFKWSPVKVYRHLIARGVEAPDWRLLLTIHHRSGFTTNEEQNAVLVVTIRDPQGGPVYDGVVAAMRQSGWVTQDLAVQNRLRARPRG